MPDDLAGQACRCDYCGHAFTPANGPHRSADAPDKYGSPHRSSRKVSNAAITALNFGLLGILFAPLGLIAIIFGVIALKQTGDPQTNRGGAGLAIIGVICGALGLLAVPFLGLLPVLSHVRRNAHMKTNAVQMRGIQQGLITFCPSNRTVTGDGFYPGLNRDGTLKAPFDWPTQAGTYRANTVSGCQPATRYTLMLNASYFTPGHMLNPLDVGHSLNRNDDNETGTFVEISPIGTPGAGGPDVDTVLSTNNFSYAMLQINKADEHRRREWGETINPQASVLGDRNIGSAAAAGRAESVWTDEGSGEWEGTVVFNDGSTKFLSTADSAGNLAPIAQNTRYNQQPTNALDNLFDESAPGEVPGANCELVFQDCTSDANHHGVSDVIQPP